MWVYLAIMVLSYLMQDPETDSERKSALLKSAALTAGTYYVANQTEWGQTTFDGTWLDTGESAPISGANMPDGAAPAAAAPGAGSWFASNAVPLAVGAAGGAAATGLLGQLGKYLPLILLAGGAYLLVRASGGSPAPQFIIQREAGK